MCGLVKLRRRLLRPRSQIRKGRRSNWTLLLGEQRRVANTQSLDFIFMKLLAQIRDAESLRRCIIFVRCPQETMPRNALQCNRRPLLAASSAAEDVRVASVEDSHRRAAEELTASGAELDLFGRVSPTDALQSLNYEVFFAERGSPRSRDELVVGLCIYG